MLPERSITSYVIYIVLVLISILQTASAQPCQTAGTIFNESVGTVSTNTTISNHESANGFDNDSYTMSGTGEIRSTNTSSGYGAGNPTASGSANVFLTNTNGRNIIISGINTTGDGNLRLAFGLYKSTNTGNGADGSELKILLSTDGINYPYQLNFDSLPTGDVTAGWYYRIAKGNIPRSSNLRIQFLQNSNTTQYRIDDIKLQFGLTPQIVSSGPLTFCNGDSVVLSVSESNNYLWSTNENTQSIVVKSSGSYSVNVNCIPSLSTNVQVNPCAVIVNIKAFIEGYYLSPNQQRPVIDPLVLPLLSDTVVLELHDTTSYQVLNIDTTIMDKNGMASFNFPLNTLGSAYYFVLKHRTSIPTWSKEPVVFNNDTISYDFTISTIQISNPLPVLNNISPNNIVAGSSTFILTLSGSNFINGSTVKWNGNSLATTFINANQLTASVAASLVATSGSASVTVYNPTPGGGTSSTITFTITSANPVPVLTSLSPSTIVAGSSTFSLTLNGSNFINGSLAKWNGTSLTTSFISANQLTASIASTLVATAGNATITVFNPTPGGGTSLGLNFIISNPAPTPKKFLFDATKAETAGNADWVIDQDGSPQRFPTPAQSGITSTTAETFWTGAISQFGIDIVKSGNSVETLPSGTAITYGNSSNTQDLSNYHVFVIDEPNIVFTATEKTALLNFVNNGGGLFVVVDHTGSDRNNDGMDSPAIINDLMTNNNVQTNPFGLSVNLTNISQLSSNVRTNSSTNPILNGTAGTVTQLEYHNGATLTLNASANSTVTGLIWENGFIQSSTRVMCASAIFGLGRFFIVTDSSPMDDGTGASGNTLFVGYSTYSHKALFMNAALWLAKLQ